MLIPDSYANIFKELYKWNSLGWKQMESGSYYTGRQIHLSDNAYLHQCFTPLSEFELALMESQLGQKIPEGLKAFYNTTNGLSMFNHEVSIYGFRPQVQSDSPYDIFLLNSTERPTDALPHHLFLGTINKNWNFRSLIYIDLNTLHVYESGKADSIKPTNSWATFADMLLEEYKRVSHFFDDKARDVRDYSGDLTPEAIQQRGKLTFYEDGAIYVYLKEDSEGKIKYSSSPNLMLGFVDDGGVFQPSHKSLTVLRPFLFRSLFGYLQQVKNQPKQSSIPYIGFFKLVYGEDWYKEYVRLKSRAEGLNLTSPTLERIMLGEVNFNKEGYVDAYLIGDSENYKNGPDLRLGQVDALAVFKPSKQKYSKLINWLRGEMRKQIEEFEIDNFDLWMPEEWHLKFGYGASWSKIWRKEVIDTKIIWKRK